MNNNVAGIGRRSCSGSDLKMIEELKGDKERTKAGITDQRVEIKTRIIKECKPYCWYQDPRVFISYSMALDGNPRSRIWKSDETG